jgi:hypothetical protein
MVQMTQSSVSASQAAASSPGSSVVCAFWAGAASGLLLLLALKFLASSLSLAGAPSACISDSKLDFLRTGCGDAAEVLEGGLDFSPTEPSGMILPDTDLPTP